MDDCPFVGTRGRVLAGSKIDRCGGGVGLVRWARVVVGVAMLLLTNASAGESSGGAETNPTTIWHDLATELPIEGKAWTDTRNPFDRLPAKAESVVRPAVWNFSHDSSGIRFRFVTDAGSFRVRWSLRKPDRFALPHMPATGVSGVDVYVRDAGKWRWLAVGRPENLVVNERILVQGLERERREFLLYLPLYNGVNKIEVGLPGGATFEPAPTRNSSRPPIVFYGTSVTQGGCASRPGMAYPSVLGRALDWPIVNLGFSGNGKTEPEVAQLLAELAPAAYVLDSLGNLDVAQTGERVAPFVSTLRHRHPSVPIVLVEGLNYADTAMIPARRKLVTDRNTILRKLYERLRKGGDENIHYISSAQLLGGDGEDTVDGTHPTDLGFWRIAQGMEPILRDVLAAANHEVADDEAGFEPLFDGTTLSGWEPHDGMPPIHRNGKWWVEDGVLHGTQHPPGKGGLLWLNRPFADFVLRFQVQLTYPMDTGVFLRVGPSGLSHQVNLDYRPNGDVGAIFIPFVGHRHVSRFSDGARLLRPDAWNDVEVRMEGEPARIRVWLNTRLLTDFQHTPETTRGLPREGGLAFQVHPDVTGLTVWKPGASVRFRHVRIKALPE